MARPLRIEFENALYHITSRGNRREDVYLDDADRNKFLELLSQVCDRYNWICHSYCLMSNHYHLLVKTPDANLSAGMRQLNGVYTQKFNYAHQRVGHVFQGRYRAILVQEEAYLLELSRYIVLNPVRGGMVRSAGDWPWSSYRATAGITAGPDWLEIRWLLGCFGKRRKQASMSYRKFVAAGIGLDSPWFELRGQIFLGDDEFVKKIQAKVDSNTNLSEIPRVQRKFSGEPISVFLKRAANRNEGIYNAYRIGGHSMKAISDTVGLHYSTVSKIIKAIENSRIKT